MLQVLPFDLCKIVRFVGDIPVQKFPVVIHRLAAVIGCLQMNTDNGRSRQVITCSPAFAGNLKFAFVDKLFERPPYRRIAYLRCYMPTNSVPACAGMLSDIVE